MSLLTLKNVVKRFGGITAVDHFDLDLEPQRIFGLIGPNGSGKSTLFNCVTGHVPIDEGEILFKGKVITKLKPNQICALGICRTHQLSRVFPELTVLENLVVVGRPRELHDVVAKANELIEYVGLTPLRSEFAGNLSYGQQKLVELTRALMTDPELLMLDEFAAGVNPTLLTKLLKFIAELPARGKTVLIVEHNMHVISSLCEHVFVLDHGTKICEGTAEQVRNDPNVIEAYFGKERH